MTLAEPSEQGNEWPRLALRYTAMHLGYVATNYELRRALVRCRSLLLDVYALPAGTLPPELEEAIEDLLMPGYRERVLRACLASLPRDGARPA